MPEVIFHPMEWYIDKLRRDDPFTLLLLGDGELTVATGNKNGKRYTDYKEEVDSRMQEEILGALKENAPDIIYGTDQYIINYDDYNGGDANSFKEIGKAIEPVVLAHPVQWYDGVLWDVAVSNGNLAPFLKQLHDMDTVMVGNKALKQMKFLHPKHFVAIPPQNAYYRIDEIEESTLKYGKKAVYIVCMGLGAAPLIMRLRKKLPGSTFLDLGSTFDVFVGMGHGRGWRDDLYKDDKRLAKIIRRNTEGVCNCKKVL